MTAEKDDFTVGLGRLCVCKKYQGVLCNIFCACTSNMNTK